MGDRSYVRIWHEETEDWRVATPEEAASCRCRQLRCPRAPVAAFLRSRCTAAGIRRYWWLYCDQHLFGRTVARGKVYGLRSVPSASEAAQRHAAAVWSGRLGP